MSKTIKLEIYLTESEAILLHNVIKLHPYKSIELQNNLYEIAEIIEKNLKEKIK